MPEINIDKIDAHGRAVFGEMPKITKGLGISISTEVELPDDNVPEMDPDPRAAAAPLDRNPLAF